MDKEGFVKFLKEFKSNISDLKKECAKITGKQIQTKALLNGLENASSEWFDQIEPVLRTTYQLTEVTLDKYRKPFGEILELSGGKPSINTVQSILDSVLESYQTEILVPVQKQQAILSKFPSLDIVLSHAIGLEIDYLTEAIECARLAKRRAAIILGWCATIDRLHRYIEKEGFDKFNQASVQMSVIQSGRYKRFNNKFDIHNLSDLRMTVFDGNLLWVLEFLGAIDGNQHEKLEICFTMRNTCAHSGDATVSDENILSFFSDVDALVFANPKFKLN